METKTCKSCEETLVVEQFYKQQQKGNNGQVWYYYDSYCKNCRGAYTSERRKQVKRQAVEYLGGACKACGLKTEIMDVYDFHHVDPLQKDFSIAKQAKSFEKIVKELDKCVLLCANCHRIEHAKNCETPLKSGEQE